MGCSKEQAIIILNEISRQKKILLGDIEAIINSLFVKSSTEKISATILKRKIDVIENRVLPFLDS